MAVAGGVVVAIYSPGLRQRMDQRHDCLNSILQQARIKGLRGHLFYSDLKSNLQKLIARFVTTARNCLKTIRKNILKHCKAMLLIELLLFN